MAHKIISWLSIGVMAILLGVSLVACTTTSQAAEETPAQPAASAPAQTQQSSLKDEWLHFGDRLPHELLPQDSNELAAIAVITVNQSLLADVNLPDSDIHKHLATIWNCITRAEQKANNHMPSRKDGYWRFQPFHLEKLGVKMESPSINHFTFLLTFPEHKHSVLGESPKGVNGFQAKVTITVQSDSNVKPTIISASC